MGLNIFLLVVFIVAGMATSTAGWISEGSEDKLLCWMGGMFIMAGIWEIWVIYKFYLLPLGL